MGPNLFAMMFVLAVFQGLSLVARVIAPEWFLAHATPIRFWCFLAMFVTVWWRVILLLRIQHEDAIAAHEDAMGAHREAADAHEDAAEAHRDAAVSHQDAVTARDDAAIAQEDTRRTNTGDTDPDLKPVA